VKAGDIMHKYQLEVDQASAYFDEDTRIVHITYHGVLTGDVTHQVYDWLDELFRQVDLNTIHGEIFDFRQVTEFDQSNLKAARKTSSRMNMKIDTSHLPVALIVGDFYHKEILHSAMRISPEHTRKRIVWSDEEALDFLAEWQKNHRGS
jgi:hypothetical protein